MTDTEKIAALQQAVVAALNAAPLPLGVKALVLENALLKVQMAMLQHKAANPQAMPAEKEEP